MLLKLKIRTFDELKPGIFIFLMVLLSDGMFWVYQVPASIRIVILLLLPFVFFGIRAIKMKINVAIMSVVFIVLQGISIAVNGLNVDNDFYLMAAILFGLFFCSQLDFDKFKVSFCNVIYVIALVSSVVFLINILFPNLINFIPGFMLQDVYNSGVNAKTICWTFVIRDLHMIGYNRNFGVFVEPGRFQIFLTIAYMLEFFCVEKVNKKHIIALTVALITCRSTTGFFAVLPIIVAYIYDRYMNKRQQIKKKSYIIIFLVVVAIAIFIVAEKEFVQKLLDEVTGKLLDMSNYSSYDEMGTGLERTRSVDVAWQIFKANPITGLGYKGMISYVKNLSAQGFIMTFTPLNWFARFGFVFGLLSNIFFFSPVVIYPRKMVAKILVFVGLFFAISTQEVSATPFIWVMICYGTSNTFNHRKEQKQAFAQPISHM